MFDAGGLSLDAVAAFVDPSHREYRERVVAFCREEIGEGHDPDSDGEARVRARELVGLMGRAGLFRPIAQGDVRGCVVAREVLGWWSPLADAVFALQGLSATPGLIRGADAGGWVERALVGDAMGAFAMTEWEAGSDVASMTTTAVPDGAGYRLSGGKTFISNAGIADFYLLFAVTDPGEGVAGISAFLLPADTKGFRFVRPLLMADPHPLGEIALEDCRLPASARVGGEGEGYKLGLATLDRLRPTVGAAACGMAGRALHEALHHALSRRQFGRALADFQITQEKVGRMGTDLTAARLLVYRAAWERDGGADRTDLEAAMAKSFATEIAQGVVDDAVQILGGRGVLADHPVDRLYRSVRALRIYEGATEIQRLLIARHLFDAARGESDP